MNLIWPDPAPSGSTNGQIAPAGELHLRVVRTDETPPEPGELSVADIARLGLPWPGVPAAVCWWRLKNVLNLWRGARRVLWARLFKIPTHYGVLFLEVIRADGTRTPLGLASMRVVTTAGVNFIVDAFQNIVEPENMKYHGIGTGTTAEASGDTALVTELTTEYSVDNTRPTGTTTEGATANIYRTVATITVDATVAATEHGVFTQAATGGGTLLDRTKFAAINLSSGDGIAATYELTFTAGS